MRSTSVRVGCPSTGSESVCGDTQRGGHLAPCECASVPSAKGRSTFTTSPRAELRELQPGDPRGGSAPCAQSSPVLRAASPQLRPLFSALLARKRAQTHTRLSRLLSTQLERQGSLSGSFQLGPNTHTHTRWQAAILSLLHTQLSLKILQTPIVISYISGLYFF